MGYLTILKTAKTNLARARPKENRLPDITGNCQLAADLKLFVMIMKCTKRNSYIVMFRDNYDEVAYKSCLTNLTS